MLTNLGLRFRAISGDHPGSAVPHLHADIGSGEVVIELVPAGAVRLSGAHGDEDTRDALRRRTRRKPRRRISSTSRSPRAERDSGRRPPTTGCSWSSSWSWLPGRQRLGGSAPVSTPRKNRRRALCRRVPSVLSAVGVVSSIRGRSMVVWVYGNTQDDVYAPRAVGRPLCKARGSQGPLALCRGSRRRALGRT